MPRFPDTGRQASAMRQETFLGFADKIRDKAKAGTLIPMHLGDASWLPPEALLSTDLREARLHQYGPVEGWAELRQATVERLTARHGIQIPYERLLITSGATGALTVASRVLFDPGDEVLVVTPTWPLIFGILQGHGVVPVEVDISTNGWPEASPDAFIQRLSEACTTKTAGLYLCSPNNPSGFIYSIEYITKLAAFARERNLWVVADEAYMDLCFGASFIAMARCTELLPHLVLIGSFSKTFAMSGHRLGFMAVPQTLVASMMRGITHTTYQASSLSQRLALRCIEAQDDFSESIRQKIAARATRTCKALHGYGQAPEAGMFMFLDLRTLTCDANAATVLMHECLDRGVSLVRGGVFGQSFGQFARLCYTATSDEKLDEGLLIVGEVLARPKR